MTRSEIDALSKQVLNAAFAVHTELGPGLLESAYCACLASELEARGLSFLTEVPVPLVYKGEKLSQVGFRIDFMIAGEIVLEIKAVENVSAVHLAQLVSYLKLADKQLGFLINFHTVHLKDGISRRVNGF